MMSYLHVGESKTSALMEPMCRFPNSGNLASPIVTNSLELYVPLVVVVFLWKRVGFERFLKRLHLRQAVPLAFLLLSCCFFPQYAPSAVHVLTFMWLNILFCFLLTSLPRPPPGHYPEPSRRSRAILGDFCRCQFSMSSTKRPQ